MNDHGSNDNQNWTYSNEAMGLEFKVPKTWSAKDDQIKFPAVRLSPKASGKDAQDQAVTVWKAPGTFTINKTLFAIQDQTNKKFGQFEWVITVAQSLQEPIRQYEYATYQKGDTTYVVVAPKNDAVAVRDQILATINFFDRTLE